MNSWTGAAQPSYPLGTPTNGTEPLALQVPTRQIPMRVEELAKAIDRMGTLIGEVRSKLDPLMTKTTDKASGQSVGFLPASPLADEIARLVSIVTIYEANLTEMLNRLDF